MVNEAGDASFEEIVLANEELDFVLLLVNALSDCHQFALNTEQFRLLVLPPYWNFLVSSHTIL